MPHSEEIPVTEFKDLCKMSLKDDEFHEQVKSSASDSGESAFKSSPLVPGPLKQKKQTDLIRDFNL